MSEFEANMYFFSDYLEEIALLFFCELLGEKHIFIVLPRCASKHTSISLGTDYSHIILLSFQNYSLSPTLGTHAWFFFFLLGERGAVLCCKDQRDSKTRCMEELLN